MPLARAVLAALLVLAAALPVGAAPERPETPAAPENRSEAPREPEPAVVYPEIVEEERRPAADPGLEAAAALMRRMAAFALDSVFLLVAAALAGIGAAGVVTLLRVRRSK